MRYVADPSKKRERTDMGSFRVPGLVPAIAILAGSSILAPGAAVGQDDEEKELGWFFTAELTAVFTGGNAVVTTSGLGASVRRVWEKTELTIRAGGLKTRSGIPTRSAVGTVDDFQVSKQTNTEVTAENYYARSVVDRTISKKFFLFGSLGWERNTFSGYNSRSAVGAGGGNNWADDDRTRFKTSYGLTYTFQDDVVENPAKAASFGGVQVAADFWRQFTDTAGFESLLIVDENLKQTQDLRADWTNSILVDISDVLALRASFQVLFDNLPSLTTVALEMPAGTPTGETVLVPLDKVDTKFTIALVANF